MNNLLSKSIFSLALGLAGTAAMASGVIYIDKFDDGGAPVSVLASDPDGTFARINAACVACAGNFRALEVTKVSSNPDGSGGVRANVIGGDYNFSTDNDIFGSFRNRWDGSSDTNFDSFGLGLNLSDKTSFVVRQENDVPSSLGIRVYTDAGNWASLVKPFPAFFSGDLAFAFDDFVAGAGTLDWANIGAIEIYLADPKGAERLDLDMDFFATSVPEPGSLALLGFGLLGLGLRVRRKG